LKKGVHRPLLVGSVVCIPSFDPERYCNLKRTVNGDSCFGLKGVTLKLKMFQLLMINLPVLSMSVIVLSLLHAPPRFSNLDIQLLKGVKIL